MDADHPENGVLIPCRNTRQHNDEVQFYAFDVLMSDGDDLRKLPLSMRKANLARLLARRVNGFCQILNAARSVQTCFAMPV